MGGRFSYGLGYRLGLGFLRTDRSAGAQIRP
jgi:hypothetical protein